MFRLPWQPHCDPVVLGSCGKVQQRTETAAPAGRRTCVCVCKIETESAFFCHQSSYSLFFFSVLSPSCLPLRLTLPPLGLFSLWPGHPVFPMRALLLCEAATDPDGSVWRSGGRSPRYPGKHRRKLQHKSHRGLISLWEVMTGLITGLWQPPKPDCFPFLQSIGFADFWFQQI